MNRTVLYGAALLLLVAGVLTIVTASSLRRREPDLSISKTKSKQVATPAEWMTDYILTERSGRKFDSQELSGKVHVVNFFFTTCPSVCRMQSGKVAELAEEFGPQGVVFVSITCDPDRDTPAVLQQYANMFEADPDQWLFLTSHDLTYLRRVGGEVYQLAVDTQTHSEHLVVLDKWGKIRGRFHWDKPTQLHELRQALAALLVEQSPPTAAGQPGDGGPHEDGVTAAEGAAAREGGARQQ